jgi:hypothetical protein
VPGSLEEQQVTVRSYVDALQCQILAINQDVTAALHEDLTMPSPSTGTCWAGS